MRNPKKVKGAPNRKSLCSAVVGENSQAPSLETKRNGPTELGILARSIRPD